MPGPLTAALTAPLRELQTLLGPGGTGSPPVAVLTAARDALTETAAAVRADWRQTEPHWQGAAAAQAADVVAGTGRIAVALADGAARLAATTDTAAVAISDAAARLRVIIERFEARAGALEAHLDEPGVAAELIAEARQALAEALGVVDDLHTDLARHATALTDPAGTPPPARTVPSGFTGGSPPLGDMGSGLGGLPSVSPGGAAGSGLGGGAARGLAELAGLATDRPDSAARPADPAAFGVGVAVRLPDGSTVTAPNAVAADAVRHALTQLGVPYQWGGTTPGVGLDCSGLTQWAYQQAGLQLPRLAQEQDVGAAVDAGALLPGDLAVWDGHVAMVVGNGMMIEAGDPVKLSPIRTTNAGQGFQGFWRPTG
ncbi:C40 family peptidase [Mycolicibacterium thermoresistibile]